MSVAGDVDVYALAVAEQRARSWRYQSDPAGAVVLQAQLAGSDIYFLPSADAAQMLRAGAITAVTKSCWRIAESALTGHQQLS